MPLSWNEIKDNALKFSREWAEESSDSSSPRTKWSELAYVTKNKRFSPCKQDILPGYKGG